MTRREEVGKSSLPGRTSDCRLLINMLVSSATPRELAEWFHREEHGQRVLCLLLAPSVADQAKLASTIDEVCLVDSTIGQEIALLLIDSKADYRLGFPKQHWELGTFPARAFSRIDGGPKPVIELRYATGLRKNSKEARRRGVIFARDLAFHTARFVPEFLAHFEISPRDLPCLCLFVRGLPQPAVIALGGDWGASRLLALLTQVRSAVDAVPDFNLELTRLPGEVAKALPKAEDLIRKLDRRTLHLTETLDHILNTHVADAADIARIAELVSRGFTSSEDFEATLGSLMLHQSPVFRSDKSLALARNLLKGVLSVRAQLQALDMAYNQFLPELVQRAAHLAENRQRLLGRLRSIEAVKLSPTTVALPDHATSVQRWLEAINLSGDLAEKARMAVLYLRQLAGL